MTLTKKTPLPRKWHRIAPGRMELDHDGCSFEARDLGIVEPGAGWRLECVGPKGSDTFTEVKDFATVKQYAHDWYESTHA